MPKDTFYNLPDEKRKKIEDAAITEFRQYHFDMASVNRIVENSGISKGSFYQYFEDKKDLYKHIINGIIERKRSYLSPVLMNPEEHDFFTFIREVYISGLRFATENSQLVDIGNFLLSNPKDDLYIEIMKDNINKSDSIFEALLMQAIEKGEIREDIDLQMTSFLISSLNISIVDYYQKQVGQVVGDRIMDLVDGLLNILQYGLIRDNSNGRTKNKEGSL